MAPLPPVNFDFRAANALLTQIDTTTRLLRQQKKDRWVQGLSIRTTWKGPYAKKHDVDRTNSDHEAEAALNALTALRAKVQAAIDAAQLAQRKIDQQNQAAQPHPSPAPGPAPVPPR